ncbi:MAG: aldehyde dehydrogenase family protein [Candidatus Norongarragalinales archaeon]
MNFAMEFKNYVGGKDILFSGKNFVVESEFYPDYRINAPESCLFDIKTAISKAKNAVLECRKIPFDERVKILKRASEKFSFKKDELEYIVKNTGMPISVVQELGLEIKQMNQVIPALIEKRIGTKHGKFGHDISKEPQLYAFFEPVNGIVYGVTPGNDIRVTAFIASWLVSLGLPGIIKCSKNDLVTAQKSVRAIVEAGYPAGALSVLCWDTGKQENSKLNFELADAAKVIWAYGDDKTVDTLLRFEEKENGHVIDHFSDKIVLRHATGRAAGICDKEIEPKQIAEMIVESSLRWPIGCNSLKMLFDASKESKELGHLLKEKFEEIGKHTGDPMNTKTKVGFTSPKLLNHVWGRIGDLKKLGLIEVKTGEKKSETQATPMLLETKDKNSEFLNTEFSTYILTMKKCNSFEEALVEANESAGPLKRLAVSIFSHDGEKVLKSYTHAHHVRRMRHTTEVDLLFHEGNDYFHKLMQPQIHRCS